MSAVETSKRSTARKAAKWPDIEESRVCKNIPCLSHTYFINTKAYYDVYLESVQVDSEVAHWHANARPDSESVGPAGLCATLNLKSTRPGLLWAALDSPSPALGRTWLTRACSGSESRSPGRRAASLNLKSNWLAHAWSGWLRSPGLLLRNQHDPGRTAALALNSWLEGDSPRPASGRPALSRTQARFARACSGPHLTRPASYSREPALGRSGLGLSLRGRLLAAVLTPGNVSILHSESKVCVCY